MIKPQVSQKIIGPDFLKQIAQAARAANGSYVEIGWPESSRYPEKKNVTAGQVALWNEFGTKRRPRGPSGRKQGTPARPFLRPALDNNQAYLASLRQQQLTNIVFAGWSVARALQQMGFLVTQLIRKQIQSNPGPANATYTLEQKKKRGTGSRTLLDTRRMLNTIGFTVFDKSDSAALAKVTREPPTQTVSNTAAPDRKAAREAYRAAQKTRPKGTGYTHLGKGKRK